MRAHPAGMASLSAGWLHGEWATAAMVAVGLLLALMA